MELVLYSYWRSSSSHRVRIALALKNAPFRLETVDLFAGNQSTKEHVARSPMGYVPCLVVDGEPFVESVAIIELLDDLIPSPRLFPADPKHRARVRAMIEIINAGIQPLQNLRILRRHSSDQKEQAAWAREFNQRGLEAIEQTMEAHEKFGVRGRYAYGDEPTAADAFLLPQVTSARRFGADLSKLSRVTSAADAFAEHPAAKVAAPLSPEDNAQPDAIKH
jgi:maleylacetoacetate isomerase